MVCNLETRNSCYEWAVADFINKTHVFENVFNLINHINASHPLFGTPYLDVKRTASVLLALLQMLFLA